MLRKITITKIKYIDLFSSSVLAVVLKFYYGQVRSKILLGVIVVPYVWCTLAHTNKIRN
jgi:hypothetical protein